MWRIKRRRTKPKTEGNKVIYPKLNATAKPNRYQSRNTYLDVKCNKKLGAGCTNVGCQCKDLPPYPPPNITSFSDITGVADYKTRVNTIAPASFHDFTTWYGPVTNLGTTYQGVYGNSAPPSGNANFSLPLPTLYNHISITYNNPHPGSGSDAVYIFIGGVGSGALPTENPLASQAVNEIKNGTTGASKTYSQRYQAGDYLKIQEKASVITTALVIELTYVPNIYCCKTAPYRNPILGYREHLVDACQRASGIFVSGSSSLFGPPVIPSNNTLMYSTDGINWVGLGNTVFGSRVDSVKWNGKIWVAVGGHKDTNSVAYSYDGFNWVGVGDPFSLSTNNGFGIDVASNGSDWIAISNNNIIASTNGIDWNPTNLPASFSPFGIAYGQDKWLLFGEDLNPSPKKNIWYSTDNGNSWSSVSMDGLLSIYADRGFYNGSLWVAVGTGTNKIIYSADGVNWNAGNNVGITTVAQDVFYNGFIWIAGGEGGQPLVWSDDGINWNPANNQPLSIVNGVTWNSSINLWVATNGSSVSQYDFAYSEDGKTWTGVPKDTNLMNTGTGNYLGSGNTDLSGYGYTKDVSGNVYKDNYAKTCATHPEACYNQVIKTKQNKNGCVDESYNYSTNQYLNRRCLKFQQQEFNFLSQVPVDNSGCGTKFAVCPNCQLSTETAATSIIVAPTNNSANSLIYTRDGNAWIGLGNDIFSATPVHFVKNNGNIWVAGGTTANGGTTLAYSINGINWTGTQTPSASTLTITIYDAAYSNNLWMAIADYGNSEPSGRYKILSSSNGIDWVIKFNIPITSFQPSSIEYGNGTWIIFGKKTIQPDPSNVYVSVDEGNSWSFKSTPLNLCSKGFYGDNLWVAVGATSPVGGSAIITSNDNGSTWTQITSFYGNFKGVGSDIFYNGNLWVVVGSQGPGNVSMAYSNDGLVWNAITNPIHNMYSVAWKPGGPWVASSDTTGVSPYYYSDDGITWTASSTNIVSAPQQDSYLGGGISTPFIPANKCICNKNGFCTGINKLPCETKNTKCYAIYKRSNPKFKKQGAVSGGSRINRLKYQTRMKAQGRTVNGRKNVINGRRPATLYRTSKPLTLRDNTCINPPPPPSDLSYETLSGSIIVTWRAGDISKLCRIAPLTGFTIQRTGSPFGHTEPVFGNTYTYSNLPIGSYDIRVRADSYYGSSDWAYLNNILVGNVPSAPVILDNTVIRENEQITFSFIPPAIIPGFPIQSYQYSITSPITFLSSPIAPPANNTIVVAPNPPVIDNCVPYTIKMHAINSLGVGDESNSIVVASIPGEITFTIQQLIGSPLPEFVNLSDGKYLLFDIGSNTNTTWNFNIIDISNSCPGEPANLKIDYLVVGGGGSGGSYGGGNGPGRSTTGGGGGGEVRTGSFDISGNSSFEIEVGRGDDPTAALAAGAANLNWSDNYNLRFSSLNSPYDASGSTLTVTDIATSTLITNQNAFAGQHGANTTGRKNDNPIQALLEATDGGAYGAGSQSNAGSVLNPDPNGTSYSYATETGNIAFNAPANGFIINMRGSAGGGSNANDGGDSGGTDCSGNAVSTNNFMCSGGNGANGVVSSITGTTQYYGAAGGGAAIAITNVLSGITFGAGGLGGGGDGAYKDQNAGGPVFVKGDNGTGYGAGGGGSIFTDVNQSGGNGYRGVVILKFYSVSA